MKKTIAIAAAALLMMAAGCHVQVDKDANGNEKNVRIQTPMGGLHVRAGQTTAADVGLPVYPGATIAPDKDGDKSADVHMGFGAFQLTVKVVNYESADSQDKVLAFYRKALGRFGAVIECQGKQPVGSPATTQEGLSCSGTDKANGDVDISTKLNLKAGSPHHQHLFVVEQDSGPGTRFALIELQLPTDFDHDGGKSE